MSAWRPKISGLSYRWRNNSGPGRLGGQLGQITSNPKEDPVEDLELAMVGVDIYNS